MAPQTSHTLLLMAMLLFVHCTRNKKNDSTLFSLLTNDSKKEVLLLHQAADSLKKLNPGQRNEVIRKMEKNLDPDNRSWSKLLFLKSAFQPASEAAEAI